MNFHEQLASDLKEAMIKGNALKLSTLRLLKSELKNAEIAQSSPLEEKQILQVIRKEVKKRVEAAELLRKTGNEDRALTEESEAQILEAYLPAQIDISTVENFIKEFLKDNPTANKGEVIKTTMNHFEGQTDGKTVSGIVTSLLG